MRGAAVAGDGSILTGQVRGSGRVYDTMVFSSTGPMSGATGWTSTCTCPVAGVCKHAVALLLAARGQALGEPRTSGWRDALLEIVGHDDAPRRRLALEVAWGPRTWSGRETIGLLPLVEGKRGWNRRGASWGKVVDGHLEGEVDDAALAAVRELGRMGAATLLYDDDRLFLDDMPAAVWPTLRRAVAAGVELTTAQHGGAPVYLDSGLTSGIKVGMTQDGDAVVMPLLALDGVATARRYMEDFPAWQAVPLPVGDPVHGLGVALPDGAILLVPLEEPASGALTRLLMRRGEPIVVPAADVPHFEAELLPSLARTVPLVVTDPGITVPEPVALRAVLRVSVQGVASARTTWLIRYLSPSGRVRRQEEVGSLTGSGTPGGGGGSDNVQGEVPRDVEAEKRLAGEVMRLLGAPGQSQSVVRFDPGRGRELTGMDTVHFLTRVLPRLRTVEAFDVEVVGDVPDYREAEGELVITTDVDEEPDQPDWFSLRVRVQVGREQVPMERLMAALAAGRQEVLLDSGAWVRLAGRPEVARLAALMEEGRELADPQRDGRMRVSALQAGYYAELVALGVVGETAQRWRQSVDRLLAHAGSGRDVRETPGPAACGEAGRAEDWDVPVPAGLQARLRPYQEEGYQWLHLLRSFGLGGVLADDMGLGKTVQVLAEVQRMAEERAAGRAGGGAVGAGPGAPSEGRSQCPAGPVLVVAPTSVVGSWVEQAQRFCPDLRVRAVTRTAAKRGTAMAQEAAGADVVVMSYTLVRLDQEDLAGVDWSWVVCDEAQFIKNHASATYRAVRSLRTPSTVAITGTPLENSLMDLWSLMSVSAPGLLPGPERFTELYRRTIERGGQEGLQRLAELRRRIGPFMLRRTKEQVAADLPDKSEQVLRVELGAAHRRAYERRLARERQKVMGLLEQDTAQSRFSALRSLTILRQMALDPDLVEQEGGSRRSRPTAKVEMLLQTLGPVVAEGHKALVFSQFTRYLTGVRQALEAAGLRTEYLDGATSDRAGVIERFRAGQADVFLISLKAGGFGLTLTEADYVFLLDPWWNPQVEEQAVDRTHRIGQDKPVMVYRMVSAGTIEDKVMDLKVKKADLFEKVIEGVGVQGAETGAGAGDAGAGRPRSRASLTAAEIRDLLA